MLKSKWLVWILPIASLPFAITQVPVPHASNGKRDLAGYWQVLSTASTDTLKR